MPNPYPWYLDAKSPVKKPPNTPPLQAASGNGTDDDAPELQAMLAYLGESDQGGGTLYIPAGVYRLMDTLVVPPNVRIFGDGMFSTILHTTGQSLLTNGVGLLVENVQNIIIEDLGFLGIESIPFMQRMLVVKTVGDPSDNCRDCIVRNCRFFDLTIAGQVMVEFLDTNDCVAEGCIFDTMRTGLLFRSQNEIAERNVCRNCDFTNFVNHGLWVDAFQSGAESRGTHVFDSRFYKPKMKDASGNLMYPLLFTGIELVTAHRDVLVASNTFLGEGGVWDGMAESTNDHISLQHVKGGAVLANTSQKGGRRGAYLLHCESVALNGNQFDKHSQDGIQLSNCLNCTVSGNVSSNNGQSGAANSAGFSINGTGGGPAGSNYGSQNVQVVGNVSSNDAQGGSQDWAVRLFSAGAGGNVLDTRVGSNHSMWTQGVTESQVNNVSGDKILGTVEVEPNYAIFDAILDIPTPGSSSFDIGFNALAGSQLRSVQAIALATLAGAGGATRFAVGFGTSAPDMKKYGISANLLANTTIAVDTGGSRVNENVVSDIDLKVFAFKNNTTAGGTISGKIRVKVVYELPLVALPEFL